MRTRYNSNSKTDFFNLPSEAQTAIFSFYYQNGWKADNTFHKKYYDAVINQNWNEAATVLKNASEYKNRRNEEADLFKKIKQTGDFNLPSNATSLA
ncbi:MAG: hypothetical protein IPP29_16825 [Bacteroidetes bacterium]|nr:hypothetical protein [Bacteroidota bacterium]